MVWLVLMRSKSEVVQNDQGRGDSTGACSTIFRGHGKCRDDGWRLKSSYFQIFLEECGVRTLVSGMTNFMPSMRVSNCQIFVRHVLGGREY